MAMVKLYIFQQGFGYFGCVIIADRFANKSQKRRFRGLDSIKKRDG
jgi:hypothetical protein